VILRVDMDDRLEDIRCDMDDWLEDIRRDIEKNSLKRAHVYDIM
jgi:hypothetical protein